MRVFFRLFALWVTVCAVAVGCNSQSSSPAPDARKTLTYLASDEMEGRGVGTEGLNRAAEFIARQFESAGLKPMPRLGGFFQSFEMTMSAEIGPDCALCVGDRSFTAGEDFTPISFSSEGKFDGAVVFAGYGVKSDEHHYDDYAGLETKGKVVLVMRYEPHNEKGESRFAKDGWSDAAAIAEKAKLAKEHGATALLIVTPMEHHEDEKQLMTIVGRGAGEPPELPIMHVKQEVAEAILGKAGELKTLQQKIDRSGKPASEAIAGTKVSGNVDVERKRVGVKNVVAYRPGKVADEFVVIGAHYDHLGRGGMGSLKRKSSEIHNGADDNASGTTALLMLARQFGKGPTPERSLIFVAFSAEEEGCLGSKHFVDHPPVPLEKMVAMVNLDMVGRIRTPTQLATTQSATAPSTQDNSPVLQIGGTGTAPAFDAIIAQADTRSPLQMRDIGRGGLGPSDHMSFALKKVPVMFFFSGLHSDYHRPTDDAEKINYEGIGLVVDFVADVIRQLEMMPKQTYVDSADKHSMRMGVGSGSGSGSRVTLGVIPDYSAADAGGGVKISGTSPDSPAAKAGLKAGDTIVSFGEKKIDTLYDLSAALSKSKAGQTVKLKVLRGESKTPIEIVATLAERKG